jgi:hypothetical protein
MPRRSRIDAAGALHHVMVRGIERGAVFRHFFNIGKAFIDMLNISPTPEHEKIGFHVFQNNINHTARIEPPGASGRPVLLAQSFKIRDCEGEI